VSKSDSAERHYSRAHRQFAEAKELIAGFAILEVRSKAEAVEHARKWAVLIGAERVDVRRVVEFSDFE